MPDEIHRHNLTKRDRSILEAIHYTYDGMLGATQIMRLFFKSWRMTRGRLSSLYQAGYLERPDIRQRAGLDDMPYWLGEKGAAILAEEAGMDFTEFYYRKKPRWSQINHDLAVNTFQMDVRESVKHSPKLEFIEWVVQGEFWRNPDIIEYKGEHGARRKRGIRPDGYFAINAINVTDIPVRFLVEIDMSTEDNPRFAREKTIPLIAYLKSAVYKARFGIGGRVLVVTTSQRRLTNMKSQTERTLKDEREAKFFCFTTFDKVSPKTLFSEPIWYVGGVEGAVALLDRGVWA